MYSNNCVTVQRNCFLVEHTTRKVLLVLITSPGRNIAVPSSYIKRLYRDWFNILYFVAEIGHFQDPALSSNATYRYVYYDNKKMAR